MQSLPAHTYMLESEVETENNEYKENILNFLTFLFDIFKNLISSFFQIKFSVLIGLSFSIKIHMIS